tara:strand:+ start:1617 stop:2423 length:807 start_codon:yes stop_codon:yes gene_type:complete
MFIKFNFKNLLQELSSNGSFLLPLRLFIGLGWFRGSLSKLLTPSWHSGEGLKLFLIEHLESGSILFPAYEALIKNIFFPNLLLLSWMVIIGQFLTGIAILSGTFTNFALLVGIFMNFNFILTGATNPSAFYIIIQLALLLSNTGVILGFDKILSRKIRFEFLTAQPEDKKVKSKRQEKFFLFLFFIALVSSLYSAQFIKDFSPHAIEDQAMILFILFNFSSLSFLIKYQDLSQKRKKDLNIDDKSYQMEAMSTFVESSFQIKLKEIKE